MTTALDRPTWSDDGILADRVRSRIGSLVKRMDQPRVHVMAANGTVTLHGDVSDASARTAIEDAVGEVLGVSRVDSHLHVGLARGDSRPSSGRRSQDSPLLRQLLGVAGGCGLLTLEERRHVLRGVLSVFAARLPERARRRFLQHLPRDVRRLATPARWLDDAENAAAAKHDFIELVAFADTIDRSTAERLAGRVLMALRRHSPADAAVIDGLLLEQPGKLQRAAVSAPGWPVPVRSKDTAAHAPFSRPVAEFMTRDPVTIRDGSSMFEAFELMSRSHVHHLPIVRDDGRCVALLDALSVVRHLPEAWVARTPPPLHEPGGPGALSVLSEESLATAARHMHQSGVDACCVVDRHGHLVGVLTARDLIAVVAGVRDRV